MLTDEDVDAADARAGLLHRRRADAGSRAAASAWTWSPPRSRSSAARCTWRPQPGQGTRFTIRLPFTLAVSHALIVRTGDEYYALPLPTVEGVVRLPRDEVAAHLRSDSATFSYGGHKYRLQPLALFVGMEAGAAARAGRRDPGGAGARRRAFHRARGRRADRQPRDRRQAGGPADLLDPRHLRRDHPRRRPRGHHPRHHRAGARRVARCARRRRCRASAATAAPSRWWSTIRSPCGA